MKTAYALLGVLFILLVGGALFLGSRQAEAPTAGELSANDTTSMTLTLTAPAFEHNTSIPSQYTCDGENKNPRLEISGVPEGTKSLALIMDDPDIPDSVKESRGIDVFDHWVLFNLPADAAVIEEASTPPGTEGANSAGGSEYTGPCPPDGEHRYFFKLYALDTELDLPAGASKADVEAAMTGNIIEQTELVGLYERQ